MALNGCEISAKILGIKWYWMKKVQLFGYFFSRVLGIEPNEHQIPSFQGKYRSDN